MTSSSLIPLFTSTEFFSSLSPTTLFFLEARLITADAFQKERLISELGFSMKAMENLNIGMFTRTSSVIFIAGIGSYCAYRLGKRFLGKNFVWTLFDLTKCNYLSKAESRLLHSSAEGFYSVRIGEDDLQKIQNLFTDNKIKNTNNNLTKNSVKKRSMAFKTLIKNLTNEMFALKNEGGLASITKMTKKQQKIKDYKKKCLNNMHLLNVIPSTSKVLPNLNDASTLDFLVSTETHSGIFSLRKKNNLNLTYNNVFDDSSSTSSESNITSISRIQHISQKKYFNANNANRYNGFFNFNKETNDDKINVSSASTKLTWENEQFWDYKLMQNANYNDDAISGISELTAFKNLQIMFKKKDEENSLTQQNCHNYKKNLSPKSNSFKKATVKSGIITRNSVTNMKNNVTSNSLASENFDQESAISILQKCFDPNPNYLYQSTVVERYDIAFSEVNSTNSLNSNQYKHNCTLNYFQDTKNLDLQTNTQKFFFDDKNLDYLKFKRLINKSNKNFHFMYKKKTNNFNNNSNFKKNSFEVKLFDDDQSNEFCFFNQNKLKKCNSKSVMTDSCFSKSSQASINQQTEKKKDNLPSTMFDSAIAMTDSIFSNFSSKNVADDLFSSKRLKPCNERDSCTLNKEKKNNELEEVKIFKKYNTVIETCSLKSDLTMEWFD